MSVFLPRNSKYLCTEHYIIPITNPLSSKKLAISRSPSLPLYHNGHQEIQPPYLIHSSGTKLRQHLLYSVARSVRGGTVPWGYCLQRLFSIICERAEGVERNQVAVHQVPAPPSTCVPEPWACSAPLGCLGTPGSPSSSGHALLHCPAAVVPHAAPQHPSGYHTAQSAP